MLSRSFQVYRVEYVTLPMPPENHLKCYHALLQYRIYLATAHI